MMSKKTKAMEQQLNQLAQENDALRAQLAAAGIEIENIKSELAKTVGERDRFRNELNGAQLDLSNAKRRLDDFRLRQEAIVNALTEAHNTRERILKEANANADRIDAEAKQRRTDILNKAQAILESAKKEAAQTVADAKRDAAGIRDAAQKDAQQVTDTALDEATELIAGAKADAETMMDEAQAAVDEKQAQVDELNFSLGEKARLALEQARKYAQIMESLAELNFETAVEARYAEKYAPAAAEPENSGECAEKACENAGVTPLVLPIRGGTDGAQLSFKGLPCPNLGTGGHGYHGPYEHITAEGMDAACEVALELVKIYAEQTAH